MFASTSLIITKYLDENGRTGFNPETGYAIDLNGTGSASEGFDERGTSPEGLEIAKMNLSGCGFSISNFNPSLFSKMYDELSVRYRNGYESLYGYEMAVYGDADKDGEVLTKDVLAIAKHMALISTLDDKAYESADVNGDGTVNLQDSLLIQKKLAKIIPEFPIGTEYVYKPAKVI